MEQTEALDDVVTMAYGVTNGVLLESVVVKDVVEKRSVG